MNCLISAVGLPERIEKVALPKILKAMAFDKKFSGKTNRFVLLNKIGRALVRTNVPGRMVRRAIADHMA